MSNETKAISQEELQELYDIGELNVFLEGSDDSEDEISEPFFEGTDFN